MWTVSPTPATAAFPRRLNARPPVGDSQRTLSEIPSEDSQFRIVAHTEVLVNRLDADWRFFEDGPDRRYPCSMPGILDPDSVGRFSRPFDVLELLAGHPGGVTLTEISTRLKLPTSSTHNILHRMVSSELITVTGDLQYSLGPRAVRLGFRIVDGLEVQVRLVARKHLMELARDTGEHVYLAVVLGRRVVYVDRVLGTRAVGVDIRLGQSLFLHATSVGKLFSAHNEQLRRRLLAEPRPRLTARTLVEPADLEAEMQRIREDGFAISDEEAISGVVGYAVPVIDARGDLVAAIHISALRSQVSPERERSLLAAASAAATRIENEMGRAQPSARR